MSGMIRHVERKEIDDKKWNGCVHFAINGFPYAYTWFLDNVAENWDGLVYGDYEMVFPLVWNRKFGMNYLYAPALAQQLGLFSLKPFSKQTLRDFLDHIPEKYRLIEMKVNYRNEVDHPEFKVTPLTNYVLDLQQDYETLQAGYSENTKRNIRKAEKNGLTISSDLSPEKVVDFFVEHVGPRIEGFRPSKRHFLYRIVYHSMHYNMGSTFGVYDKKDQLCATAFFLYGRSKIINLLPASSEEGRQMGAAAFLTDHLIRRNAGQPKVLDFEGSMIPSVARFYKSFGASEVTYFLLSRNKLPWFIKLFKR